MYATHALPRTSNSQHLGTNQATATPRRCVQTRPRSPCCDSNQKRMPALTRITAPAVDTCHYSGPYSHPHHCRVLSWICGTHHLNPYPTYATAHTTAQYLDLVLARQMQTHHEREPGPYYKPHS
eukprot:1144202-Pelagomonas_calceolata.AAC.2